VGRLRFVAFPYTFCWFWGADHGRYCPAPFQSPLVGFYFVFNGKGCLFKKKHPQRKPAQADDSFRML
jgi:hypothetical protein